MRVFVCFHILHPRESLTGSGDLWFLGHEAYEHEVVRIVTEQPTERMYLFDLPSRSS